MEIFIDIETVETQDAEKAQAVMESAKLSAPNLTKPKLIEALGLGDSGKYKTAPELKELWIEQNSEAAKKEALSKTALNGDHGEIVSIAWGGDIDKIDCIHRSNEDGSELALLTSFWHSISLSFIDPRQKITFIAHNKNFDLPFLYKRSVINGVKPPIEFDPYARHHICTMEMWQGFKGMIGLDKLAGILGVQGKSGEGCQVAEWWKAGEYEKIAEYNKDDVRVLIEIYNKMKFK